MTPEHKAKISAARRGWIMSPEAKAAIDRGRQRWISNYVGRYWAKVDKSGGPDACWPWSNARERPNPKRAYSKIIWYGTEMHVHRIAVLLDGRKIPPGLVVDHLCHNVWCVNPKHLRVTTQKLNTTENSSSHFAKNAARTHCVNGHPFSGENLAIGPSRFKKPGKLATTRICLTCHPRMWMYSVVKRDPPPGARLQWRGPFKPK